MTTATRPRKGRGTSNSWTRGNAADRRKRKDFLLAAYGDGTTVKCWECPTMLTAETMTVDRVVPGIVGGSYWDKWNIRPHCAPCSRSQGWKVRRLVEEARIMTAAIELTVEQEAQLRKLIEIRGTVQDWDSSLEANGLTRGTLVQLGTLGLVEYNSRYGGYYEVTLAGRAWVTNRDAVEVQPDPEPEPETPVEPGNPE